MGKHMSQTELNLFLPDERATQSFAAQVAKLLPTKALFFLYGDLGSGKTTFCRALLHGLGHQGKVKSPTYTLVEDYKLNEYEIFHFDLYRLADPQELEFIGIEDYLAQDAVWLIEWPEKGQGFLPNADLSLTLSIENQGRHAVLTSHNLATQKIVQTLQKEINK